MSALLPHELSHHLRLGIELGFRHGRPVVYDGTEPVAIDAQAGKGKLARFLGVNLVSPRTAHLTKIITDPKDAELAWASWKTLEREGYRVRFINPDRLHSYPSESYNINTRLLEIAAQPELRSIVWQAAYDAASYLVPVDPSPSHKWIGQGVRTSFALYNKISALHPSHLWPCTVGGLWDFFGRDPAEIADDLLVWASDSRMEEDWGMCRLIASLTASTDQWNAYSSTVVERLQGFQPSAAARTITEKNSFDPADMKREKTALFIIGSARSDSSRTFVGAMTAAIIERFADAHGPLRALVVGEEWGQLYVSNFSEILTLYRQGGINFLGVFQNASAQIEARYGRETARIWKKAVAHTLYRGLPDDDTLRDIEHRSGKTSVMVRGFNVNMNQVNGSGDNLSEQARPLLQVEDIRRATGGDTALLESRDQGYFVVDMPNFWERTEMSGMLRDVRQKPDKYDWIRRRELPVPLSQPPQDDVPDSDILTILRELRSGA
jgi:type IV secretion system protein VirD4